MLDFLSGCVEARLNIVISGGSGSGKTTMLNTLSRFIPEEERIVTIEDTAELQIAAGARGAPGNAAGEYRRRGRDHAARPGDQHAAYAARPHHHRRVRGAEALDMLQAMNTGHDGSMTTCHANPARRVFAPGNDGDDGQPEACRTRSSGNMLASAIHIVVHMSRIDGRHAEGH